MKKQATARKQLPWKWSYLFALLLALAILLAPVAAWAADGDEAAPAPLPSLTWSDDLSFVKQMVRNNAFYDLSEKVLNAKDVPSLIAELKKTDKWAEYYTAEAFASLMAEIEGDFVGIGIYADTSGGQLLVQGVIANSPAEKAGLKFGDIIVGVDGLTAPKATAEELMAALGGEENSLLTLKYKRGGQVIEEVMSRKRITIPSTEYWLLEENIAYLQIEMFTTHTGEELAAAVKSLKKQGMKALIVDLRGCPGGELEGAVGSSGVLAGSGPMFFFLDKDGWYSFAPVDEDNSVALPLAVLINGETASAAEIVAANVQDKGVGVLIGVPSFGKGVMQTLMKLPSGAGIKFTTEKIITHGYQDIDAAGGVLPDIYVVGEEAQLAKAQAWLKEQLAKPAYLKFFEGQSSYSLGGVWKNAPAGLLLSNGASYVPLDLTLAQLGWQQKESEGIVYYSCGTHRLIVDKSNNSLITAAGSQALISQGGALYMPAALLRQFGYTVTWNNTERSVRIGK